MLFALLIGMAFHFLHEEGRCVAGIEFASRNILRLGVALLGDFWRRPIAPDYPIARRTTLDRLPREEARRTFAKFVPESGKAVSETVHWWMDHAMSSAAPAYRITAPVLAIAGGQDHVNPASTVRRIVNRFPTGQARFRDFPEMSHWLIGEPEWPQVAATVLEWMAEQSLKPNAAPRPRKRQTSLFGLGETTA
jgi:pimeloyl-ACP methyl ester carboxylesterase